MNEKINISQEVLLEMYIFLNTQKSVEHFASVEDMHFIKDGSWLKDSAVIDVVNNRNGAWDVYMIFAHHKNPLQFIVRNITRCYSKQKALATAFYIRKEAAKDRRGTLNVSINDLNICSN